MSNAAPWFLLRTLSGHERLTLEALREKGLTAYVPLHITKPPKATRKAVRTRPLMPGYVFICLPDSYAYHVAKSVHGVIGFMTCPDGSPRSIPAYAVGVIAFLEACHEWDETWEATPVPKVKGGPRYAHRWAPGDRVRVTSGPYEDRVGTVLMAKGKDRFNVLFSAFGLTSEASFQEKHLVKPREEDARRAA